MNIEQLIRENQEQIINSLINIFNEQPKKSKSPSERLKFRALGKNYDSDKSIVNYVNFIKDLSSIHPYEKFKPILRTFINKNEKEFTPEMAPSVIKIKENFYLTKKLSNKLKEIHLEQISKDFSLPIHRIND